MCTCENCGKEYFVDLIIPDNLWEKIRGGIKGSGLLCSKCIMERIEIISDCLSFVLIK